MKPIQDKCLYDQWFDGYKVNINNFTHQLFIAFIVADGVNRNKILELWPELFLNSENI